jgi:2'-5' RNA ligase
MTTIDVPVNDNLKEVYETLDEEQKSRFHQEIASYLFWIKTRTSNELRQLMHEISQEAKEKGLTEETLEQLLAEDSDD